MSTLDEICAYILEARCRCARGIARENQRVTLTGKPNPSKLRIGTFERGIAKYDRWLAQLDPTYFPRPSADPTGSGLADVSEQGVQCA